MFALRRLSRLAALAVPLALSMPAYAQPANPPPPMAGVEHGDGDEYVERRDLREEREKIRAAFEDLETERDQLKIQCMDAKGQERSECRAKWQAFHQRKLALHKRVIALHEAVEADRAKHGFAEESVTGPQQAVQPQKTAIGK